jgi:hypothetical protein
MISGLLKILFASRDPGNGDAFFARKGRTGELTVLDPSRTLTLS